MIRPSLAVSSLALLASVAAGLTATGVIDVAGERVAAPPAAAQLPELGDATIRSGVRTAAVSAFWNVDRQYLEAPGLKPRSAVVVADLKGPGVITLLRLSAVPSVAQANLLRGLVLEITFDGANEPAVLCPVPDFFADGCNGKSVEFGSRYVEKVPWAWNAYFPMPFRTSARLTFRNDTDVDTLCYSYLEWQALPAWGPDLGYFHATYRRLGFQLTNESRQELFRTKGRGHILGRQLSIATDEPTFRGFSFVMEGNNEVDIDGQRRCFDYLGSEDSFTFSWGFNKVFTTQHAGITYLGAGGDAQRLSIYRFHDHMPIRFDREVAWTIDWRSEDVNFGKQSGWVDYAAVFYWYQDAPGGFRHEALPPVAERCLDRLPAPEKVPDLRGALEKLEPDARLANDFTAASDLERVAVLQAWPGTHPFWVDVPSPKGGHPGQPNPGRRGILAVHAEGPQAPCYILRKVALEAGKAYRLRLVASGDPYEIPGKSDFILQAGILRGGEIRWCPAETVDAGSPPAETNWRTFEHPIESSAGRAMEEGGTIGIIVKVSYGGPQGAALNEEAFLDEVSIVEAPLEELR